MLQKISVPFLTALSENNSLAWMHQHEREKKQATAAFLQFVSQLQVGIGKFEPAVLKAQPQELLFRFNRDTRFSHDKSPYNPTFRAHIGPQGKPFVPVGYFVHLAPAGQTSFLGGGIFATQFPQTTALIREHLLAYPQQFLAILTDPAFQKYFQLQGEQLKRFPKGYQETGGPIDEFVKYKSWYLQYDFQLRDFASESELRTFALEIFTAMKPFNDYLNAALKHFEFPKRRK